MKPKFKIGDTVESAMCCGWIEAVYGEMNKDNPRFIYAIKDAEDDHTYYDEEEQIKGV